MTHTASLPTALRLALATLLAAACGTERTFAITSPDQITGGASAPPAVAVPRWNTLTRDLVVKNQPNQQAALRAFVYVSLAQREAALAVGVPDGRVSAGHRWAALRVAISTASAGVLRTMFPADDARIAASLDSAVAAERTCAAPADESACARAASLGRDVADAVLERARTDGFDAVWTGAVPTAPNAWASATGRAPLLPLFGQARTFFLASGSQVRPAAPPGVGSPEFLAALAEVRQVSDTRTPEQKRIAEFWAMASGPLVAGYWNVLADSLVAREGLDEGEAARALALANLAGWDANVACHDAKYAYWYPRPTQMDGKITLAIGLPNHPSYPSNHGCLSGAIAEILAARFPRDAAALRALAQEAVASRVYAGVHYRFDGEAGLEIARRVASIAVTADARSAGRF